MKNYKYFCLLKQLLLEMKTLFYITFFMLLIKCNFYMSVHLISNYVIKTIEISSSCPYYLGSAQHFILLSVRRHFYAHSSFNDVIFHTVHHLFFHLPLFTQPSNFMSKLYGAAPPDLSLYHLVLVNRGTESWSRLVEAHCRGLQSCKWLERLPKTKLQNQVI